MYKNIPLDKGMDSIDESNSSMWGPTPQEDSNILTSNTEGKSEVKLNIDSTASKSNSSQTEVMLDIDTTKNKSSSTQTSEPTTPTSTLTPTTAPLTLMRSSPL